MTTNSFTTGTALRSATPASRRKPRNATTLIEILGTMGVLFLMAVAAAKMLGSVTDIGIRTNQVRQSRLSIERLAPLFREDVHTASEITASESPPQLELAKASTTVRYQWDDASDTVSRSVQDETGSTQTDRFQLHSACDPQFAVADDRITVTFKSGDHPWVVEANRE